LKRILFLTLIVLTIFSCSRVRESGTEKTIPYLWFQLQNGKFESIKGPKDINHVNLLPWTVQEYVADSIVFDSAFYLAVNGHGIASLSLKGIRNGNFPEFRYFYDPLIFRYKTITLLFPYRDSIACHLYFNEMLNVVDSRDLKIQGISLVRLVPRYENYRFIIIPFQKENPEWESVGFIEETSNVFHIEWKYSGSSSTRFRYSRLDTSTMKEEGETREEYIASYRFKNIDEIEDSSLKKLITTIKNNLVKVNEKSVIHFTVRDTGGYKTERYVYGNDRDIAKKDYTLQEIKIISDSPEKNISMALSKDPQRDGKQRPAIYISRKGEKRPEKMLLPPLPEDFQYTGFNFFDDRIIVFWEERNFMDTGASGMLVLEL